MMLKVILIIAFCVMLPGIAGSAPAENKSGENKSRSAVEESGVSDQPDAEAMEIIAVMEMLKMMELMEELEMMKEFHLIAEGKDDEADN